MRGRLLSSGESDYTEQFTRKQNARKAAASRPGNPTQPVTHPSGT